MTNKNIVILIFGIICLLGIYYLMKTKEHFVNESNNLKNENIQTNKNSTNQTAANQTATNQTATNQTVTNQTVTNQTATNQTATNQTITNQATTNQATDQIINDSEFQIDIGTGESYGLTWDPTSNKEILAIGGIDDTMSPPDIVLDNIGNRKLVVYWQNKDYSNFEVKDYVIKVYQCNGLNSECDISNAEEITTIEKPKNNCNNCYAFINNLDMATNTYIIKLQIVYQNKSTGDYVKTPEMTKKTNVELEQNLNTMYQDALDHLIEQNIKTQQDNLKQSYQKMKIDELKKKIVEIKGKLKSKANYSGIISDLDKNPYPINTYYAPIDIYDPAKQPQQIIKIGDKEYYVGLSS